MTPLNNNNAVQLQREYYAQTAQKYDTLHGSSDPEHQLALRLLAGYIEQYQINSILDVGAGTGSNIIWLKQRFPHLDIKGLEPVAELREQGYAKGLSGNELLDGNGYQIPFETNTFDLVCEFAVLHHVEKPQQVVSEMSRVAKGMICISDCNFLGQGSLLARLLKLCLFQLKLWPLANWVKTKGKGYHWSEEDGIAYSYSVFQNLSSIQSAWQTVRAHTTSGKDSQWGNILSAAQLMIIAMDKRS